MTWRELCLHAALIGFALSTSLAAIWMLGCEGHIGGVNIGPARCGLAVEWRYSVSQETRDQ